MKYLNNLLVVTVLVGLPKSLPANPSEAYIAASIEKAAKEVGVPAPLLQSICSAESNLRPDSYVYSDGGAANHAIGICQILVLTAAEFGANDKRCHEDFKHRKNERTFEHCQLFGPYTNALYAAKFLKQKLTLYEGSWINAIAAYNSGTIKVCSPEGFYRSKRKGIQVLAEAVSVKCVPGELLNRAYVDRVLNYLPKYQPKTVN